MGNVELEILPKLKCRCRTNIEFRIRTDPFYCNSKEYAVPCSCNKALTHFPNANTNRVGNHWTLEHPPIASLSLGCCTMNAIFVLMVLLSTIRTMCPISLLDSTLISSPYLFQINSKWFKPRPKQFWYYSWLVHYFIAMFQWNWPSSFHAHCFILHSLIREIITILVACFEGWSVATISMSNSRNIVTMYHFA